MKEKTNWLYMSDNFENSFSFQLSKVDEDEDIAIIITDTDTDKMDIHKVKYSHLLKMKTEKKLAPLEET